MVTLTAILAWLVANKILITGIFVVLGMIVNLTPTKIDNNILKVLRKIWDMIVPNLKKNSDGTITTHNPNIFSKLFKKNK